MESFKKVISVLAIIIIVLCSMLFVCFSSFQDAFGLSSKKSSSNSENDSSLYLDDEMMTKVSKKNEITVELVHKHGDPEVDKRGYPRETIDYVLKEDNYEEMFYKFKYDCINYFAGDGERPVIPRERIFAMVERGISKYNTDKNDSISIQKVKKDIEDWLIKIEEQIDKIAENKSVTTVFNILRNKTVNYVCIALVIICMILLLVINKPLLGALYIGISLLVSGLINEVGNVILGLDNKFLNYVRYILGNEMGSIQSDFGKFGIIFIIVGILLIASYIIYKKCNKKIES